MALTNEEIKRLGEALGKPVTDDDINIARNNTSRTYDPLQFGAGGRGEFSDQLTPEQAKAIEKAASEGPLSTVPDRIAPGTFEPRVDAQQESSLRKKYGLEGINTANFQGLTVFQANQRAQNLQNQLKSQTSALTSSVFNPEVISGAKKTFNDLKFKIDDIVDNPFFSQQEKNEKTNATIESFSDLFAKNFNSLEEFNQAQQDPGFQQVVNNYQQLGGDINNIASKIEKTPTIQDPKNYQTLDQYLGAIDSNSKQQALESLIPDRKIAQDEIVFEQSIPEEYAKFYFGTEDEIGFVQQARKQAEEEIKLIERKAKIDEKNARAQVEYAMDKYKAEFEQAKNKIEENRLNAKNYITGQLAKLGALKTTGKAPEAIATLEQKYQQQAQDLTTTYNLANNKLELDLNEEVDNILLGRDQDILEIKSDLSNDEETIWKEIFKLQNDADRKTFDVLGRYVKDFRSQTEKYEKEAKAAAEKYAKQLLKEASEFDLVSLDGNFRQFIAEKEARSPLSAIIGNSRNTLVPEYLSKKIGNKKVSSDLRSIIAGNLTYDELTPSKQNALSNELTKLGIERSVLETPDSSKDLDEEFGAISSSDKTKGINYLNNLVAEGEMDESELEEAIELFKTDRRFQSKVLNEI